MYPHLSDFAISNFLKHEFLQIYNGQNCKKSFRREDFVPVVDKSVVATWEKFAHDDKLALPKGTSIPLFPPASWHILFFIKLVT